MLVTILICANFHICAGSNSGHKKTFEAIIFENYNSYILIFMKYHFFAATCAGFEKFDLECIVKPSQIDDAMKKKCGFIEVNIYFFDYSKPLEHLSRIYFLKKDRVKVEIGIDIFLHKLRRKKPLNCFFKNIFLHTEGRTMITCRFNVFNFIGLIFLIQGKVYFENKTTQNLATEDIRTMEKITHGKNFEFRHLWEDTYELKVYSVFADVFPGLESKLNFSILAYDDEYNFYFVLLAKRVKLKYHKLICELKSDSIQRKIHLTGLN